MGDIETNYVDDLRERADNLELELQALRSTSRKDNEYLLARAEAADEMNARLNSREEAQRLLAAQAQRRAEAAERKVEQALEVLNRPGPEYPDLRVHDGRAILEGTDPEPS